MLFRVSIVQYLESVLTDDPDTILELDTTMNQPMDSGAIASPPSASTLDSVEVELDQEDNEIVHDQEDQQREMRAKMLKPQLDVLNKSLDKMDDGLMQNQKVASNVDDRSSALDRELINIQNMMQQLERNAL